MTSTVRYVTPAPWSPKLLQHPTYGGPDSYRKAAAWMAGCRTVADWGASTGFLRHFLPGDVRYVPVDGTACQLDSPHAAVLADLETFHEPADGIVLRHVLDMTHMWHRVLCNAVAAFRVRLVVVTFTPDVPRTDCQRVKSGWPLWHFNPEDLRAEMRPWLVAEERLSLPHAIDCDMDEDCVCGAQVGHERLYYLEKPGAEAACAS